MIKVTEARVTRVEGRGSLKAFASICLEGEFVVDGFRVVEKDGELIIFSPEKSKRNEDGTYTHRNTAYPLNTELRTAIHTAIKDAYAKA